MNREITSTDIETVMKSFQLTKLKPDVFTWKLYEPIRELLTHALLKLFQNSTLEGKPTNSSYKGTITLIPRAIYHRKGKLKTNITEMNRGKILSKT